MPAIPYFRNWFESQYGDICEIHDKAYDDNKCLICADYKFIYRMIVQDYRTKKLNLFFSIPFSPVIFTAFQGFKVYKFIRGQTKL